MEAPGGSSHGMCHVEVMLKGVAGLCGVCLGGQKRITYNICARATYYPPKKSAQQQLVVRRRNESLK